MEVPQELLVAAGMLAVALLYSSVGHGGGSGYLAVMALFGIAPVVMRPTALTLNILVASLAALHFYRAGYFSWSLFWPFAVTSVPAAFLGGLVAVPEDVYRLIVGLVLAFAAVRLVRSGDAVAPTDASPPPLPVALLVGTCLGFLAGLVGVGGGIFLSPLLILFGWASAHTTAAVAAPFVLVNSVSGLTGQLAVGVSLPPALPLWAGAVLIGGWLGASYGVRVSDLRIRRLLAVVLAVAAGKFLLG